MEIQSTQVCISLKSLFSRHKGIGVQFSDEPTGNLDSKTSMDVIALLKLTGKEFAQTIVMITHNEEIATMADQMIRIEDGRIFSAGVPDGANGGEKDA